MYDFQRESIKKKFKADIYTKNLLLPVAYANASATESTSINSAYAGGYTTMWCESKNSIWGSFYEVKANSVWCTLESSMELRKSSSCEDRSCRWRGGGGSKMRLGKKKKGKKCE